MLPNSNSEPKPWFRFRKEYLYFVSFQPVQDYSARGNRQWEEEQEMLTAETVRGTGSSEVNVSVAPVLAIVNRKGGTGKTTATHNIAAV